MIDQPRVQYFTGLDLGQPHEFTALAVIEKRTTFDPRTSVAHPSHYAVRHLERFPLGTAYPDISARLKQLFAEPPLRGTRFVVDQTGVGRAILDLLRTAHIPAQFLTLTISHGTHVIHDRVAGLSMPKKDLVAVMQMLLQTRRIHIADSLPDANTLVAELQNFQPKVTTTADPMVTWREGQHDDLVFAVAIATWHAERQVEWRVIPRPEVWGGR